MPGSRRRKKLDQMPESRTATKLIGLVGRGNVHVSTIADMARAAMEDGLVTPALTALSACGAGGKCPQNTERDVHTWLRGAWGLELEPYKFKLNLQVFGIYKYDKVFWIVLFLHFA